MAFWHRKIPSGLWLLLLATAPAWAALTYPGWLAWKSGYLPYFNLHHLLSAPSLTWVPPFTPLADVRWGTGAFPYLVAWALHGLGFSVASAWRGSLILALVVGSLGMFLWLGRRWPLWSALGGALLWLYAPYTLSLALHRGAGGETWFWALMPWVLWAADREGWALWPGGVALAAALWSQAGSGILLASAGALAMLIRSRARSLGHIGRWTPLVVGLALGLGGIALQWRTAPRPFAYAEQAVHLYRLLWYRVDDTMWLALPAVGVGLLLLGSTPRGAADDETHRPPRAWIALFIVSALLAWHPGAALGQYLGVGHLLLSPRQWLGLSTLALSPPAAWALTRLGASRPLPALVVVTLAVLSSVPVVQPNYQAFLPGPEPAGIFGAYDLVLLDAQVDTPPKPGAEIHVTADWQALRPQATDWTVFVQVLDDTNQVRGQQDTQPHRGTYPTSRWHPGEVVRDVYTITVASDAPAQNLRLILGVYNWRTMDRLPVRGGGDFVTIEPERGGRTIP